MKPHQAYRRAVQTGWTRIEMLLAVYDGTIAAFDAGIEALQRSDSAAMPALQLRATQLCLLVISGIDPQSDEVGEKIRSLCLYAVEQASTPVVQNWVAARNVLATLREGFLEIREEGVRLETTGVISPLTQETSHTLLHT